MEQITSFFGENDLPTVTDLDGSEKMLALGRDRYMGFFLVMVDQGVHRNIIKIRKGLTVYDVRNRFTGFT